MTYKRTAYVTVTSVVSAMRDKIMMIYTVASVSSATEQSRLQQEKLKMSHQHQNVSGVRV